MPLQILNMSRQTYLDYDVEYDVILERREIGHGKYVRYYGIANKLLVFIQISYRLLIVVYHLVFFYFESNVQLKRVM